MVSNDKQEHAYSNSIREKSQSLIVNHLQFSEGNTNRSLDPIFEQSPTNGPFG